MELPSYRVGFRRFGFQGGLLQYAQLGGAGRCVESTHTNGSVLPLDETDYFLVSRPFISCVFQVYMHCQEKRLHDYVRLVGFKWFAFARSRLELMIHSLP